MQQIGRFQILSRLGSGGFGEVFLANDPAIDRKVAIKVFRPRDETLIAIATSTNEEALPMLRARFLSEARILGTLDKARYVINVLEYGELDDGAPFYVMPFLPRSLANEIGRDVFDADGIARLPPAERPHALPLEQGLVIISQILEGLAAAHDHNLIHRDIKPANVMLTEDDEVRLVDFGIAKAPNREYSTVAYLGMGSRNYMAPEQQESVKHVDARADLYATGVVAYRMLTGRLPVGNFVEPIVALPAIGQSLNEFILGMLEAKRDKRPKNGADALALFEKAREQSCASESIPSTVAWNRPAGSYQKYGDIPVSSEPETRPVRKPKKGLRSWHVQYPWLIAIGCFVVLAFLVLFWTGTTTIEQEEEREQENREPAPELDLDDFGPRARPTSMGLPNSRPDIRSMGVWWMPGDWPDRELSSPQPPPTTNNRLT